MAKYTVDDNPGQRLDAFLAQKSTEYSRSIWQKLIEQNYVQVNNKDAKSKQKLRIGDVVSIKPYQTPEIQDLPIIYQDEDVTVVNKPAGMLTHLKSDLASESTVAGFIADSTNAEGNNRAGIVHRLDRDTSGVLVTARNERAEEFLSQQFSNRSVNKWYLAVISGELTEDHIRIDAPIARHPRKPATYRIDQTGKSAQTDVYRLGMKSGDTLTLLKPRTGRTHQLRVHLKHIGYPITGDKLYNPKDESKMLLHAWQIKIMLPSGEKKTFIAELPDHMSQYVTDNEVKRARFIIEQS